ncbi:MAG TPA: DUF481 domain-containing protein [Bacteriovoracaceae bacterium]|nr:DUF481 domain-containing protein [Bacteriovoracaceae bacterium]
MPILLLLLVTLTVNAYAQYTNESELSSIRTGGNSEVLTTNTKTLNTYLWNLNQLRMGGHYTYGEANTDVSARNWDINSRYERELSPRVSAVVGEVVEGNRFIGIKSRYNSDLGLKYYSLKTDLKNFFTELSYRYSVEDRFAPLPNSYDNKGRFYNEYNHKYSETLQYRFWLEIIPNFTDSRDYLVNGEASLTTILTSMFSLKLAYLGMYDNRPAFEGFENYDFTTSTSLVAKF